MNVLSMLAIGATCAYLGIGFEALRKDPRSPTHRAFAAICVTLVLWAFGFAFMYAAPDRETCRAWDRVASFGWAFLPATSLHFALLFAGRDRLLGKRWPFALLYLPGLAMLVRFQVATLGVDIDYERLVLGWSPRLDAILPLYVAFEVYLFGCFAAAIFVVLARSRTAPSARARRQARALGAVCGMTIGAGVVLDQLTERVAGLRLPPMAPVVGLVWAGGIWYAMSRHRILLLTKAVATDQILESVRDLILLVDPEGRVADANRQALAVLGYGRDELVGSSLGRVFGDEESARKAIQAVRESHGGQFPIDVTWRSVDGRAVSVSLWGAPIRDPEGDWIGAVVLGHDLSQGRLAEDQIVRVGRADSLQVLAGGFAHDFNNVLTVVLGNLEMARLEAGDADAVRGRIDQAAKAAEQARRQAQGLVAFARGTNPPRGELDLARLVREAGPIALRGSPVRLDVRSAPDLRPVRANETQVVQVLHNLLINARQAMPAGGVVTVDLANATDPAPVLAAGERLAPGVYACLAVTDTGVGIAPADLTRVFEPFFTTKPEGTGLGLASSLSIVRRHRGGIAVESVQGRGTTFRVYLPAA
jgi:PAS domain S-box-containing protein